jgi:hypothetical protein
MEYCINIGDYIISSNGKEGVVILHTDFPGLGESFILHNGFVVGNEDALVVFSDSVNI